MKTVKYKMSFYEKWGNNQKAFDNEVMRSMKFLFAQIKKGWTPEEACEQTEQTYGFLVSNACFKYVNNKLKEKL